MKKDLEEDHLQFRTHFMMDPEKRTGHDRRVANCFIKDDRRCGVACRRRVKQREMERRAALRKVRFYPEYTRIF